MRRRINFLISAPVFQVAAPLHAQPVRFRCSSGAGYGIAFGADSGTWGGTHDFNGVLPQQLGLNCIEYFRVCVSGLPMTANLDATAPEEVSPATHAQTLSIFRGATWLISNHLPTAVDATAPTRWSLFQTAGAGAGASAPRVPQPARPTPTATMVSSAWSRM